jgi:tetratricopeptide (TPR) repeat protein
MARGWRRLVTCVLAGGVLAGPVFLTAQGGVEETPIEAARPGLQVIPIPRLGELELPVAQQLRDARRSFGELIAKGARNDGDLAEAYGSLGRVFHAYEFFEAAEAAYANAERLRPHDFRWLHLRGYLYQQTGRLEESADRFAAARRARPDDHAAAVRLGDVYLGLNRLRDAREQFQNVLTTFPAAARNGLGEVALREGRFEEAIEHFRAALARVPQATAVHYSLAMAYRGLGRLNEARVHLQQRGPGGIEAVDPIVEDLQTLVRGERLLVIQGGRAYAAGQFRSAADAFGKAVSADPASVTARANLGLALSRLGDAAGAAGQFETVLRMDANDVTAHASLGMILAGQGRDGEAVAHLKAAYAQAPDDTRVRSELVGALLRLGRQGDAIEVLERVRSADPDDEGALVGLSILLANQERYREAVQLLDEANRRLPGRPATTTTLARLLASSPDRSVRDGRTALDLALAIYDVEPAPAHAETVALALAELGRCDEAAGWMRRAVIAAEQAGDTTESARLTGERAKYDAASCRAPGQ